MFSSSSALLRKGPSRAIRTLHHQISSLGCTPRFPDHPIAAEPCHGTVPEHQAFLFLHTKRPPATWPGRIEMFSPFYNEMKGKMKELNGFATLAYTDGDESGDWTDPETCSATLYKMGSGAADLSNVSTSTDLTSVETSAGSRKVHFYVCTHGSRDCRCGDVGGNVVDALKEELGQLPEASKTGISGVSEVAHIGGHVYVSHILSFTPQILMRTLAGPPMSSSTPPVTGSATSDRRMYHPCFTSTRKAKSTS